MCVSAFISHVNISYSWPWLLFRHRFEQYFARLERGTNQTPQNAHLCFGLLLTESSGIFLPAAAYHSRRVCSALHPCPGLRKRMLNSLFQFARFHTSRKQIQYALQFNNRLARSHVAYPPSTSSIAFGLSTRNRSSAITNLGT